MGAADEWVPPAPCKALATRGARRSCYIPAPITISTCRMFPFTSGIRARPQAGRHQSGGARQGDRGSEGAPGQGLRETFGRGREGELKSAKQCARVPFDPGRRQDGHLGAPRARGPLDAGNEPRYDTPMSDTLTIRPIADGEEEAVIALWHACGLTRPWNDPAHDLAFARGKPNSDVLVGLRESRIVASAMVGHDGHRGTMYYVSVAPSEQGRGWGRQLVAAAEAWLIERGVWKVEPARAQGQRASARLLRRPGLRGRQRPADREVDRSLQAREGSRIASPRPRGRVSASGNAVSRDSPLRSWRAGAASPSAPRHPPARSRATPASA